MSSCRTGYQKQRTFRGRAVQAAAVLTFFAYGSLHGHVRAQPTDPAIIATARSLAVAGVQLAEADRCEDAIVKLQQADELHHAPVVVYHLGACHIRLGRLVRGSEILRGLLREPRPAASSPAVDDAYRRAEGLLEDARAKIASLTILLDSPRGIAARVTLDGEPIPPLLIGVARAIDPGEHVVEARADGLSSVLQKVIIAPLQTRVVALALKAPAQGTSSPLQPTPAPTQSAAPPPLAAQPASAAPEPLRPHPRRAGLAHLPAYIAWGASGAALLVGAGYGYAAIRGSSKLDARCPQHICAPDSHARLASERTHAAVSTVAFAIAAAGGIAGAVLYLTEDEEKAPAPTRASLGVGPGSVALGIQF